MRRTDWADIEANRLFDLVRNGADDDAVIGEIALAIRTAAGEATPPTLTRAAYDAACKVSGVKRSKVQP